MKTPVPPEIAMFYFKYSVKLLTCAAAVAHPCTTRLALSKTVTLAPSGMTVSTFVSVPKPERKIKIRRGAHRIGKEAELSVLPELLLFIVIYLLNIAVALVAHGHAAPVVHALCPSR